MMEYPEYQRRRKLTMNGNSQAVTLDTDICEIMGMELGDELRLVKMEDEDYIRVMPVGDE